MIVNEKKYPSSAADKFILRFPEGDMRQRLKARAALNRRSLNSEILCLIEAGLKAEKENAPLVGAGEALVAVKTL